MSVGVLASSLRSATYWLCDLGHRHFPKLSLSLLTSIVRWWVKDFWVFVGWHTVFPGREALMARHWVVLSLDFGSPFASVHGLEGPSLFLAVVLSPSLKLQISFLYNTFSTSISQVASTSFQDFLLMRAQWVWSDARSSLIYNASSAVINQGRPNEEQWVAWSGIARVGRGKLVFFKLPVIKAFPYMATIQYSPSPFLIAHEFLWQSLLVKCGKFFKNIFTIVCVCVCMRKYTLWFGSCVYLDVDASLIPGVCEDEGRRVAKALVL